MNLAVSPPAEVAALERICEQLREAVLASYAKHQALEVELRAATGQTWASLPWDIPRPASALSKIAECLASEVNTIARRRLAPPHAALCIDEGLVLRPFKALERRVRSANREEDWDKTEQRIALVWSAFSPSRAWRRLTRAYAPARAGALACQQAARHLLQGFQLAENAPVASRAGVTVTMRTYGAEPVYRGTGAVAYHTGTILDACKAWEGLRTAIALELDPEVSESMRRGDRVIQGWGRHDAGFRSRDRFELGAGINAVTFREKVVFTLPRDVAEAAMRFLAAHAQGVSP
jgi:hypothetical protein